MIYPTVRYVGIRGICRSSIDLLYRFAKDTLVFLTAFSRRWSFYLLLFWNLFVHITLFLFFTFFNHHFYNCSTDSTQNGARMNIELFCF